MPNHVNPRKLFKYKVSIDNPSIPPFYIQEFSLGDSTITQDKHGINGAIIKTAGTREEGNATLTRLLPATGTDSVSSLSGGIWNWAALANDGFGSGSDPLEYKRPVRVDELANDGFTVLDSWFLEGCWPTTINGREFKAADSGNRVESLELSVDRVAMNAQVINVGVNDAGNRI